MVEHECPFRPLPLLRNPHLQTVIGTFFKGTMPDLRSQVRHLQLPDGDWLVLHDSLPRSWRPGAAVAVLVHGLGGCHRSGYMQRLALGLQARGVRAVRLDLRGVGEGARLSRRTYNAACSADVRAALEEVRRWAPGSPLVLAGFSLGGNIVLKLAGEAAANPLPGLARVVAVGPPIDMERCAELIAAPRNRFYESYFVRNLQAQVRLQQRYFPDLPRVRFPCRLSLRGFDDLYTAPRGGFAGAQDYYRRSGALPLIAQIRQPTLIVTARDDPFIAVEPFEELPRLPNLEVRITPHGGHLGFLGWDGAGGIRWAEQRVVDWLTRE